MPRTLLALSMQHALENESPATRSPRSAFPNPSRPVSLVSNPAVERQSSSPSSPPYVRDVTPPPPAPSPADETIETRGRKRSLAFKLAAGAGVLGVMTFTLGIVVGFVAGPWGHTAAAAEAAPVQMMAARGVEAPKPIDAPVVIAPKEEAKPVIVDTPAPTVAEAPKPADAKSEAKLDAKSDAKPDAKSDAKNAKADGKPEPKIEIAKGELTKSPAVKATPRARRYARRAAVAAIRPAPAPIAKRAKPTPPPAPPAEKVTAPSSNGDELEDANAADELAKAQLEASMQ